MPHTLSLAELIQAIQTKQLSSVELTTHFLTRISAAETLNAFISVDEAHALQVAKLADQRISQQQASPLTGIPLAHKDNLCTSAMRTTCASKMLADFTAPYDATPVRRLVDAGTVLVGKTNMDQFAMGSSSENSFFGPVRNPWNPNVVPGGSSGGSAAAVAARLVPFATGSDTGGSIRQPAAFCGISGLKPTYGLVSRYGLIAYASSFDQVGLMAPSAEDLAILLPYIAGVDPLDSTSMHCQIPDYSQILHQPLKAIKIGLPSCFFHPEVDATIQSAVWAAIDVLKQAGAEIIELDLQLYPHWIACYYALACAEASSNLSRFDGIRFGHRATDALTLRDLVTKSRTEGFGNEVKRRILTGTYILSSAQFDDYYVHAQKVRHLISNELLDALSKVDVILGPTTPTQPFLIGESQKNPLVSELSDIFTVAANLAGLPALSIPIGFENNLPIGMQLLGPHFGESTLLHLAHIYQTATDWHKKIPTAYASGSLGAAR